MSPRTSRPLRIVLCATLAALALTGAANAATALAGTPHWKILARTAPTYLQPGEKGQITAVIVNLGDAPVVGTEANPIVVSDALPAGVIATGAMSGRADNGIDGVSRPTMKCSELRCTFAGEVPAFISFELTIPVQATQTGGLGENEMRVEGANAPLQVLRGSLSASAAATPFGVENYEMSPEGEDGSPDLQAGSHPFQLTTTLLFNQKLGPEPADHKVLVPGTPALLKNLNTVLPAGLVADAGAIPQCAEVDFSTLRQGDSNTCPPSTALGAAVVTFKEPTYFGGGQTETVPVFNLVPAPGEPARLGFEFASVPVTLDTSIKTGEGYAAEVKVANNSQAAEVMGTILTVWGVPGDPRHDEARGWACLGRGHFVENLVPRPPCTALGASQPPAYLSMPTTCEQPLLTSVQAQSWTPGAGLQAPVAPVAAQTLNGCSRLPFNPSISVTPDRSQASTPSGLNIEITVPQETTTSAGGLAEADIRETTMSLPEGLQASAGAADGLETCGVAEAGFAGLGSDTGATLEGELAQQRFTAQAVSCPDASKIGDVAIRSPLLEHELKGFVYMAQQDTNPFASPLVLYLIAQDPVSGVRVKLAGEIKLTPTGQLISVFRNTPPLPFETLRVHLFDGPRASQATPAYCRSYTTVASFVPWTGSSPAVRSSSFAPTSGPNGTPCQSSGPLPFTPSFQAGVTNNQAAGYTPFTLMVGRPDGDQALTGVTVALPPGVAAKLSSLRPCPEPPPGQEWSCGPDSLIGHAVSSSGLGSNPVTLGGDVYLTTGYDGAPFGLLASTVAKAGPFDLGVVNVRSRINVDPTTAAVTVTTDPGPRGESLPTILKGVPVQLKALYVSVDRPEFEFNPTSCSRMSVTGTLTGDEGAAASQSTPFQVTNCATLPFAPKLTVGVGGQASKKYGASFNVKIQSPGFGQANIQKVFLTIPSALPARLDTIQKACPDTVFEANPATCDEGSVIGRGTVHTPVLSAALTGPAYLVSHGNRAFPDVEFVLQGEGIRLVVDGHTDIKNGVTYSRFEAAPDAPFTSFEAELPTGPHSALTAYVPGKNYNLCGATLKVPTTITAQNGAVIEQTTAVGVEGCKRVLGIRETNVQKLAKALRACSRDRSRVKRKACERLARRRYRATGAAKKRR